MSFFQKQYHQISHFRKSCAGKDYQNQDHNHDRLLIYLNYQIVSCILEPCKFF